MAKSNLGNLYFKMDLDWSALRGEMERSERSVRDSVARIERSVGGIKMKTPSGVSAGVKGSVKDYEVQVKRLSLLDARRREVQERTIRNAKLHTIRLDSELIKQIKLEDEYNAKISAIHSRRANDEVLANAKLEGIEGDAINKRRLNDAKVDKLNADRLRKDSEFATRKLAIERTLRSNEAVSGSRAGLLDAQRGLVDGRTRSLSLRDEFAGNRERRQAEAHARRMRMSAIRMNGLQSEHNGILSRRGRLLGQLRNATFAYVSIYTAGRFLRTLAEISGEFELQEKSLSAIIGDADKAHRIFTQIKSLAVESPFQFSEMMSYVKQLSAFSIPVNELYDTTKRLADVSAGLGVDMSRIILAYGQVRSAAVLRGQELRQLTEAGIPMVQALADKFSILEGRVITAGDVFERISKRMVPFEMVKEILEDMTNVGGKFYNQQQIQADTLKGKLSNLTDAFQVMLSEIGSEHEGILKGGVDTIRLLFDNWRSLAGVIGTVVSAYGTYRGTLLVVNTLQKVYNASLLVSSGRLSLNSLKIKAMRKDLVAATASQNAFALSARQMIVGNVWGLIAMAVAGVGMAIYNVVREATRLNRELDKLGDEARGTFNGLLAGFDDLLERLSKATRGTQEYKVLIGELNRKYGDYLPKLYSEADAYKEIAQNADLARKAIAEKARSEYMDKGRQLIFDDLGSNVSATLSKNANVLTDTFSGDSHSVLRGRLKGIFGEVFAKLQQEYLVNGVDDGLVGRFLREREDEIRKLISSSYEDKGVAGGKAHLVLANFDIFLSHFARETKDIYANMKRLDGTADVLFGGSAYSSDLMAELDKLERSYKQVVAEEKKRTPADKWDDVEEQLLFEHLKSRYGLYKRRNLGNSEDARSLAREIKDIESGKEGWRGAIKGAIRRGDLQENDAYSSEEWDILSYVERKRAELKEIDEKLYLLKQSDKAGFTDDEISQMMARRESIGKALSLIGYSIPTLERIEKNKGKGGSGSSSYHKEVERLRKWYNEQKGLIELYQRSVEKLGAMRVDKDGRFDKVADGRYLEDDGKELLIADTQSKLRGLGGLRGAVSFGRELDSDGYSSADGRLEKELSAQVDLAKRMYDDYERYVDLVGKIGETQARLDVYGAGMGDPTAWSKNWLKGAFLSASSENGVSSFDVDGLDFSAGSFEGLFDTSSFGGYENALKRLGSVAMGSLRSFYDYFTGVSDKHSAMVLQLTDGLSDYTKAYNKYRQLRLDNRDLALSNGANASAYDRQTEEGLADITNKEVDGQGWFARWIESVSNLSIEKLEGLLMEANVMLTTAERLAGSTVMADGGLDIVRNNDGRQLAEARKKIMELRRLLAEAKAGMSNQAKGNAGKTAKGEIRDFNELKRLINGASSELKGLVANADEGTQRVVHFLSDFSDATMTMLVAMKTYADAAAAGISKVEKASVILAVISAGLRVLQALKSLVDSDAKAKEEAYRRQLKLNASVSEYNRLMRESNRLVKETYGGNPLLATLRTARALVDATREYNGLSYGYSDKSVKVGSRYRRKRTPRLGADSLNSLFVQTHKAKWWQIGDRDEYEDLVSWTRARYGRDLVDVSGQLDVNLAKAVLNTAELGDGAKHFLEQMIKSQEEINKLDGELDKMVDSMFGRLGSDLTNAIIEGFSHGTSAGVRMFDNSMREIVRNFARQALVMSVIEPITSKFNNNVREVMKAGGGTNEILDLLGSFVVDLGHQMPTLVDSVGRLDDDIFKRLGFRVFGDADGGSSNSVANGIKGISEATANRLGSYVNAIRADVSVSREELVEIRRSVVLSGIHVNILVTHLEAVRSLALRTANGTEGIYALLKDITSGQSKVYIR